jgi:hypothetical protein
MYHLTLQTRKQRVAYKWIDVHALAMTTLLAVALLSGAYVARDMITTPGKPVAGALQVIEIGGRGFAIERDWLLGSAVHGDKERISLRLPLARLISSDLADPDAAVSLVYITSDNSLAPSERVRMLYARFLSSDAAPAAGGLIRRQFRSGTPYEGETLFLSPPEGRAFAARCPDSEISALPVTCFAEIRHAGYDIQIQLAKRDLALWEKIVAHARELPSPTDGRGSAHTESQR